MNSDRSLAGLFGDLIDEGRALMRNEIRLAKTEAAEKLASLKMGIVFTAIAAILLLAALLAFLEAGMGGLMAAGFSLWASALIVGAIVLGLGLLLLAMGLSRLKPNHLAPKQTARQLRADASLTRDQVHT